MSHLIHLFFHSLICFFFPYFHTPFPSHRHRHHSYSCAISRWHTSLPSFLSFKHFAIDKPLLCFTLQSPHSFSHSHILSLLLTCICPHNQCCYLYDASRPRALHPSFSLHIPSFINSFFFPTFIPFLQSYAVPYSL